eukprot:4071032-Pyramimonas_sp.AAC.1
MNNSINEVSAVVVVHRHMCIVSQHAIWHCAIELNLHVVFPRPPDCALHWRALLMASAEL